MRIKTKWHKTDQPKSPEDVASALAFIGWRIAMNRLEHLESEGFPIRDNAQRFAIIEEFLAFQLQAADRSAYRVMGEEERRRLVTALAHRFADILEDNLVDVQGLGDYRRPFIELLNRRSADYAELSYTDSGPGYSFLRYFGERVSSAVGEGDNRWVMEQVVEIEAPEAVKLMNKAFTDLLS